MADITARLSVIFMSYVASLFYSYILLESAVITVSHQTYARVRPHSDLTCFIPVSWRWGTKPRSVKTDSQLLVPPPFGTLPLATVRYHIDSSFKIQSHLFKIATTVHKIATTEHRSLQQSIGVRLRLTAGKLTRASAHNYT